MAYENRNLLGRKSEADGKCIIAWGEIDAPGSDSKINRWGEHRVLGQNGRVQNGTDKMVPIESSINQAI